MNALSTSGSKNANVTTYSRDFELLLLCAHMTVEPSIAERIRAVIRDGVDWDVVIPRAHYHRVLPLLCRNLERVAPDLVPDTALSRLRAAFRANATRNLSLTAELFRILDLFQREEIPCIPYKGPVLAALAYGDISLRQFADLDIIVPVGDVSRGVERLVSSGYRVQPQKTNNRHPYSARTEKDITLRRDGDISIELHWGITTDMFHPIQLPPSFLWRGLMSASVAGRMIQTHTPADDVLIHCIHGVSHGWARLGWLCDFAQIIRSHPEIAWNRVLDAADAVGARRILCHGLALSRELLDVRPPSSVAEVIDQDPVLDALSEDVKAWMLTDRPISVGEIQRYFIKLREHPTDKARVVVRQVRSYLGLTARDSEAFPVPAYLNWILYIVRPFRLAREHGLGPFLRFFKGVFEF